MLDLFDFFDFFDFILDPVMDLFLCKGDFAIWLRKRFSEFLLSAGTLISILILSCAIRFASVFWVIVGAIGTVFFVVISFRYTIWWIQYGRFGGDPPWVDEIPFPKGDLTNTPPEDAPFGRQPEPNIREQMGVQK